MAERKLNIIINAVDNATKTISSTAKGIGEKFKKASATAAIGLAGLTAASVNTVKAFQVQENAETKLNTILKNTGKATDAQIQSLKEYAAQMEKTGVVGDELVIAGQAQLATFDLSAESIKVLSDGMADLVVNEKGVNATQEDFFNKANLIGKVMSGQVGALSKAGVSFTDLQAEILKTGTEMEKAQLIAEILASTNGLGGLNQAMADTSAGGVAQLQNSIGTLKEEIGRALNEAIGPMVEKLRPIIDSFAKWVSENQGLVLTIVTVTGAVLALIAVIAPLALAIGFILSPMGLVAAAIVAFIAILIGLIAKFDEFKAAILTVWEAIKSATIAIWESIKAFFVSVWEAIRNAVQTGIDTIKNVLTAAWEAIKGVFVAAWEAIKLTVQAAIEALSLIFQLGFDAIVLLITTVWEMIKTIVIGAWEAIKLVVTGALEAIGGLITGFIEKAKAIFTSGWEAIKGVFSTTTTSIKETVSNFVQSAMDIFSGFMDNLKTAWSDFWGSLSGTASGVIEGIKGFLQGLADRIGAVIDRLIELKNKAKEALGIGGGGGGAGGGRGRSATGGNRFSGERVLVGERGPEEVVFGRGANIIPNHRMTGGGGGVTINVNVTGNTMLADDRAVGETIGDLITQQFQLSNKFA